jgi:phage gpG-like protein
MLKICSVLMQASVARTFRDEGSPAGSWPRLALSTLKKKGYTTGHKLLVLSGRLFGSITYTIAGSILTIGTALVYAAVHQFGSKDWMGGAEGPRTAEQMTAVGKHRGAHDVALRYEMVEVVDRHGNKRMVPRGTHLGVANGRRAKLIGPHNRTFFDVIAHLRRQNIPARPFLVLRPEDPERLTSGVERYLAGVAARGGKAATA